MLRDLHRFDLPRSMARLTLEDVRGAESLEVVIDDYGYTGEGFVELDDGWLSVPGALPGERARVDVEEESKGGHRIFARVVDIVEASEQRRDPMCERDAACRGCQLRHMSVAEELRFKRRTVREVLDNYGDLPPDAQPEIETITPRPTRRGDAYRIRTRLTYERTPDGDWDLGLVTPVRPEFISMGSCPALTGSTRRLVTYVERTLEDAHVSPPSYRSGDGETPSRAGIRYVAIATPTFGRGLIAVDFAGFDDSETFFEALDSGPAADFLDDLAERLPEDVGLSAFWNDNREYLKSPERITLPFREVAIEAGYDDWFPATLEPTRVLYETLIDEYLAFESGDSFLDVGCGVGTLSLLVAPHVEAATGIDINRHSIEAAELNAVRNDIEHVEFLPSGWEKALRKLVLAGETFDLATVNPMREPLGERPLAYLDRLDLRQIVYLGPSPESSAKDLGTLRDKAWSIDRLAAANLHPATYHTMLVASLRR